MEEKIIVESKVKSNVYPILWLIPAFLLFFIGIAIDGSLGDFLEGVFELDSIYFFLWTLIIFFIILAIISYLMMGACELVVADKRIYGKIGKGPFRKSVSLPIDMVSATAIGIFSSLSVSTSSGRIKFYLLENREELNSAIINLLFHRQGTAEFNDSTVDEQLKKYKDLLDSEIITQEEFDTVKKQLLGI